MALLRDDGRLLRLSSWHRSRKKLLRNHALGSLRARAADIAFF